MGKKKKETIRIIIRKDTNKEDYTFVRSNNNNILDNKRDNESTASTNNEERFGNKSDVRIEKKKIHSKKSQQKGKDFR
jgi:hypothetical protein